MASNKKTVKDLSDLRLAVIGLGYVGLPLAVEFGKKFETIGFDTGHSMFRLGSFQIIPPSSFGEYSLLTL